MYQMFYKLSLKKFDEELKTTNFKITNSADGEKCDTGRWWNMFQKGEKVIEFLQDRNCMTK